MPSDSFPNQQQIFDVFLSHNSKDKPTVKILKEKLHEAGIACWLDVDELVPGGNWQIDLGQAITNSSAVAVCFGPAGIGPWEDEEIQSAITLAVTKKKRVIPVILPDAPQEPDLPQFLVIRTWVDLRSGFAEEGLNKLIWGITGRKPGLVVKPFDGKTLNNWLKYPENAFWSVVNAQIIGSGVPKNIEIFNSPDNPIDLKSASILIWQGLVFSQGTATARLLIGGIGPGAGGLMLRWVKKHTGLIAMLHRADADSSTKLELWYRKDGGLHLLESAECPPRIPSVDFFQLTFRMRQNEMSAGVYADRVTQEMVVSVGKRMVLDNTLGYFGLAKFGSWSLHFSDIMLSVNNEAKHAPTHIN